MENEFNNNNNNNNDSVNKIVPDEKLKELNIEGYTYK